MAAIPVTKEKTYLHLLSIILSRLHYQDCVAQALFPTPMPCKFNNDQKEVVQMTTYMEE